MFNLKRRSNKRNSRKSRRGKKVRGGGDSAPSTPRSGTERAQEDGSHRPTRGPTPGAGVVPDQNTTRSLAPPPNQNLQSAADAEGAAGLERLDNLVDSDSVEHVQTLGQEAGQQGLTSAVVPDNTDNMDTSLGGRRRRRSRRRSSRRTVRKTRRSVRKSRKSRRKSRKTRRRTSRKSVRKSRRRAGRK